MDKFVIRKEDEKIKSINRTIRLKPDLFEVLMAVSEHSGVSFNKVVNQCLEYAVSHLDEDTQSCNTL